jgi:uncharacterized protein (DUF427 family)
VRGGGPICRRCDPSSPTCQFPCLYIESYTSYSATIGPRYGSDKIAADIQGSRDVASRLSLNPTKSEEEEIKMAKAIWNGVVIAESDKPIVVEGNLYFPPESVKKQYFKESATHSTCPWKGEASYYDVAVEGKVNKDAAWYYPEPKPAAKHIKDYVAFWKGVEVED